MLAPVRYCEAIIKTTLKLICDVIPKKLPVNPKYNGQDFNNPKTGYKDDQAFIYRPNAYVTQTPRSVETNQYGLAFGTAIGDIKNAEIVPHLMYNDANLDSFNNMPEFGKTFDCWEELC